MKNNIFISAVSPVYKSAPLVKELVSRLSRSLGEISPNFEIILVDDKSPDNSWDEIVSLCKINPNLKAIRLSRNFGQQYATQAGLDIAKGQYIVTLDCDLQDRPEDINKLYSKITEGYDIVIASRENRKDSFLKRLMSYLFYKSLSYLTETKQDPKIANFVLYRKNVIIALNQMKDYRRYYPMMIQWVGFNPIKIPIEHSARKIGDSSYSFKKRIVLAFNTILSFSDKPLRITIKLGVFIVICSLIIGSLLIYSYIKNPIDTEGWTSLVVLISFFSGIIITVLGVIGLYIGQMFETVKKRPTYLISDKINFND